MAYVGTPSYLGSDQATLASIIQGEAGNQGLVGMQAVGAVISNRANGVAGFSGFGSGSVMGAALYPNQFQGQSGSYSTDAWNVAGAVLNGTNPDPTGGATYYANPGASSASWARNLSSGNALQIGDHFFTDNTSGVPFSPSGSSGSIIANGPADNGMGGNSYLTMNPSDPNYGDITGLQVAGVNAPASSTASGSGVGNDQGTPNLGGGVSQTTPPAQGTPIQTSLQPEEVSQISSWISNIESAFGGGLQATLKAAETGLGTYFGSVQNWFTRAFLIIVGIVILAVALIALMWDHGGQQVANRALRVAAA